MKAVPDPNPTPAFFTQWEGGTMTFKSPELMKFWGEKVVPTPQADIYAFGLVIFQVCWLDHGCRPFLYMHPLQVLTGENPFRGIPWWELASQVPCGLRPRKPKNGASIGFSDSLWDFTKYCWSGEIESRPKVAEVVSELGKAADNWDGLMPPGARSGSENG